MSSSASSSGPIETGTNRGYWRTWEDTYYTSPPASCNTLRAIYNVVEWGYLCPTNTAFTIDTACMPWVTYDLNPNPGAFYSPATKCPTGWTAVATQSSGSVDEQWEEGETAINCCPDGFQSGSRACQPIPGRTPYTVTQCAGGETDAATSTWEGAGSWPEDATASVTVLELRYRAADITSSERGPGETGGGSSGSNGSGSSPSSGGGGPSTGAKIAIGVVIPVVVLVVIAILFFFWRRKKLRNQLAPADNDNFAPEVAPAGAGDGHAAAPDFNYDKPGLEPTGLPPQGVAVMPDTHGPPAVPAPTEMNGTAQSQVQQQTYEQPHPSEIDGTNRMEMGTADTRR